ncbi:MAG: 2-hydroxyacid dehydrogenase [Deltaproteobacteria bacterium]|nr:2-hydroxyacid dehydrogenase [Deltaproteobacteria bacterium]
MKAIFYSTRNYERASLTSEAERHGHEPLFVETRLTLETAKLAEGYEAASIFANDDGSSKVLRALQKAGVRLLALRSAGFNHVDLREAERLNLTVLRVPAYSPHAVAEHTVGLMLTLNRKYHRAYQRVREQNFSLEGLMGFDMKGKTAGVIGTGRIGEVVCRILKGFDCKIIAFDINQNPQCVKLGVEYAALDDLFRLSDIITFHCPLTPKTHYMLNERTLSLTKRGVMIINTSRGGVIESKALIASLKSGHIGSVGLDVYEEEADLFFQDLSGTALLDDTFVRLMTFPNVLITAHQGFLTCEAVAAIAQVTIENLTAFQAGAVREENQVSTELLV